VLVRGLDSTQIDMARHAIDVSVCDPTSASNLTDVRKALASSSASPALGETRKRTQFTAKVAQAQLLAPDGMPDVAFHPMGFDLNGAWGPSSLRIPDVTAGLQLFVHYGTSGTHQAALRPSRLAHDLAVECEPHPRATAATLPQPGPTWAITGGDRILFLQHVDNFNMLQHTIG
jgi:hypothetical protein